MLRHINLKKFVTHFRPFTHLLSKDLGRSNFMLFTSDFKFISKKLIIEFLILLTFTLLCQ